MSEKSVNWERSCWKRLATWRRGRRRPWRLQPPAQPSTFRTCRTSFSVSYRKSWNAQRKEKKEKWIPLRNCINLLLFLSAWKQQTTFPNMPNDSFELFLSNYFPRCEFDSSYLSCQACRRVWLHYLQLYAPWKQTTPVWRARFETSQTITEQLSVKQKNRCVHDIASRSQHNAFRW